MLNGAQFYLTHGPMEYNRVVQTVLGNTSYLAIANKLFSEGEHADIVALIAADPNMET